MTFENAPERPQPVALTYPVALRAAHQTTVSVRYGRLPSGWRPASGLATEAAGAAAPFRQCPQVGAATGCGALIEVTGTGAVAVRSDPGQRPYDGLSGATLVGVLNSSPAPVRELSLAADAQLFSFHTGGLCGVHDGAVPGGCPFGGTGFEGPGVTFARLGTDRRSGKVRFHPPLGPGATAYFALAQAPAASVAPAGSPTRAGEGGPPSRTRPMPSCGSTVNCATGVWWEETTDVSIAGRGAPLALTRTYRSDRADQDSRFGQGWVDSYGMSVSTDAGTAKVTEENGASLLFTSDGQGGYRAPPGLPATLIFRPGSGFEFRRYADGIRHLFTESGRLVQQSDAHGNTTHLTYDDDLLTRVTDPAGRTLRFGYLGGRVSTLEVVDRDTDLAARTWRYGYSGGDLTRVTDVRSKRTWTFGYDPGHRMVTARSPRGGIRSVTYDEAHRVKALVDPTGGQTSWSYRGDGAAPSGGTTTMTGPEGDVSVFEYASLELTAVTRGAGSRDAATTRYTYGPGALVSSVTDGNGHTTRYDHDAGTGDLLRLTDARGNTTTYRYDNPGEIAAVVNPLGATTEYRYDNGRLTAMVDAERQAVTYHYDSAAHPGDLKWIKGPDPDKDKQVTTLEYDDWGNVVSSTVYPHLEERATTNYTYDFAGNPTSVVDPLGGETRLTYNAAGQPEQLGAGTKAIRYDGNGNVEQATDHSGNVTRFTYDDADRPVMVIRADGSSTRTGYDRAGRVNLQVDAAGLPTKFTYDALDRVISVTDPLGRITRMGYDRAGNQTSLTDPAGRLTRYGYDEANNLVSVTQSRGDVPGIVYHYDEAGRLDSMDDGTGHTKYSYDRNDRLTGVTNGAGLTVRYTYDGAGNQVGLTYPAGTVRRTYDNADRLTTVTDWGGRTTEFEYDIAGNLTSQKYPNGIVTSYESAITSKLGDATKAEFGYNRDAANRISSATTEFDGQPKTTIAYTYDTLNRVGTGDGGAFGYDSAGNLDAFPDGTEQAFDAAGQLRTTTPADGTAVTYGYDEQGNRASVTTGAGTTDLSYDEANHLTGYGEDIQYTYDGTGQRASATVNGSTSTFAWDHSTSVPLVLTDTANSYLYGPNGQPIAQIGRDGTVRYLHTDAQGSVRMLTDERGGTVETRGYDAFGRPTGPSGGSPLGYAGQYTDQGTGFQYLHARHYDPATGQFLTRDPLAALTRAPFSYAGNNPLNAADPSGLSWWNPIDLLKKAASFAVRAARFVISHLGDIVAGVVFGNCEGALFAAAVAVRSPLVLFATPLCGALAGAAGGVTDYLVTAIQTRTFSWSSLGTAAKDGAAEGFAQATGELIGGRLGRLGRGRKPTPPSATRAA
ncbi:RHS repeat-associated core domain-containing protein [Phytohabitans flavus]|uniref:RHS repeat-associated core domain-containing protein n=1 Tax=Phytohabitans flavus TaxID=1076124 RepID=UPI0031EEF53F